MVHIVYYTTAITVDLVYYVTYHCNYHGHAANAVDIVYLAAPFAVAKLYNIIVTQPIKKVIQFPIIFICLHVHWVP